MNAKDKRHFFLWLPSIIYLLMLIHADPVVAFDNRLFLPAFSLLLPLSLLGFNKLILYFLKKRGVYFSFTLFFIVFLFISYYMPWMTLDQYRYFSEAPVAGEQLRLNVVHWLDAHAKKEDSVVLADSGLIPYFSKLNFIDSYCLNNLSMAHYPVAKRYEHFCHQILLEKPNIIILTSLIEHGQVHYTPSDFCLKKHLNSDNDYQLMKTFTNNKPDPLYRYELFYKY